MNNYFNTENKLRTNVQELKIHLKELVNKTKEKPRTKITALLKKPQKQESLPAYSAEEVDKTFEEALEDIQFIHSQRIRKSLEIKNTQDIYANAIAAKIKQEKHVTFTSDLDIKAEHNHNSQRLQTKQRANAGRDTKVKASPKESSNNPRDISLLDDKRLTGEVKIMTGFRHRAGHMAATPQKAALARQYEARVSEAYRNGLIFSADEDFHANISQELLDRGWLQKYQPHQHTNIKNLSDEVLLANAREDNIYERVAISRVIAERSAFLNFVSRNMYSIANATTLANLAMRKAQLFESLYRNTVAARIAWPRCYLLCESVRDCSAFAEDYDRTQYLNVLHYVLEHFEQPSSLLHESKGTIDKWVVQQALDKIKPLIHNWGAISLDFEMQLETWQKYLAASKQLVSGKAKIRASLPEMQRLVNSIKIYLKEIEKRQPFRKAEGYQNLWIVKPTAIETVSQQKKWKTRIMSSITEIMNFVAAHQEGKYLVQKYIERPLLIYNTKFDIRQHALLSIGADTISLWLYDDCYLRFSSQQYSLDCLQESVHLTNNAVQKNYKNQVGRSVRLPTCNMWSLAEFQSYLHGINAPADTWPKIFDGFRQNILGVVLASLEEMTLTKNGFEIYGVDFMLDENYNPILIELNTTPDLRSTTPVTGALCPRVQEDMIRVIVDLPSDPKASTGGFVKLYEMPYENIAVDAKRDGALKVEGSAISMKDIPSTTSLSESIWSENLSEIE